MPSSACASHDLHLHPFPTRRSSDLTSSCSSRNMACSGVSPRSMPPCGNCQLWVRMRLPQNTWFFWLSRMMPTFGRKPSRSSIIKPQDRKSTRLNSSHVKISYAVFCLRLARPTSTSFPYTTLFRSHFFVQFPEHGLLGGLAPVNATLRKLPAVGADALAPEHLVLLVEQDDADVRPKAVPVKHNQTP